MTALDFTKPWLKGKKVIPRKGNSPPRIEPIIKIVPILDPDTKKPVVPKVVVGVPGKVKPWISSEAEK